MIITIDGPAVSGKSTVAKALAQHLNMYYLHTGLLYRALAHALLQEANNDLEAFKKRLTTLTESDLKALTSSLTYEYSDNCPAILWNKKTDHGRTV